MIGPNIVLTLIVGIALGLVIWQHPPTAWTWMEILGLCLLVPGFALWSTARFQLGKSFAVAAKANQLVTHGLYSKLRNPIYVFGSCVIAGLILVLGYPLWLLIFAVIIPLQIWRARKEARVLEEKFGEDYRTYRASTWF
ncbi:MAG TPA: isoprenylcysteine carboxylmethyltransferase family protein [Candidatus Sulfotelmatobacter sp.]|nr:isoprenylcysteine carboxylmethyltransferase family protein [Candidatus Sulfotelmatobacter sp.]